MLIVGNYNLSTDTYSGQYTTTNNVSTQTETSTSSTSSGKNNTLDEILEEKKYPTYSQKTQEANSNLVSGISSLATSVSALQDSSIYEASSDDEDVAGNVASALKDYVSNYNSMISAAKGSVLTNKTAYVSNIMSTTAANTDKLAEIGITVNTNGTLEIDEDALDSVDISKVQEMFSSDNIISYGSTVASRLQFAGATVDSTSSSASTSDDLSSTVAASTDAAALKADAKLLASDSLYEKITDEDGNTTDEYDIDKIFSAASSFVKNYNNMFDSASYSSNSGVVSNLSYIRERTANNASLLAQFGIGLEKDGKLTIDEETFRNSDMSAVQSFFKNYGSAVATNASLVNYYMTTQANAASGYTSDGTYNVQSNASYVSVA